MDGTASSSGSSFSSPGTSGTTNRRGVGGYLENKCKGNVRLVDMLNSNTNKKRCPSCPTRDCVCEISRNQYYGGNWMMNSSFPMMSLPLRDPAPVARFAEDLKDLMKELAMKEEDLKYTTADWDSDEEWYESEPVDEVTKSGNSLEVASLNGSHQLGTEGNGEESREDIQEMLANDESDSNADLFSNGLSMFSDVDSSSDIERIPDLSLPRPSPVGNGNEFFCEVCDVHFDSKSEYDGHLDDHWTCQHCGNLKNKTNILIRQVVVDDDLVFDEYICLECHELDQTQDVELDADVPQQTEPPRLSPATENVWFSEIKQEIIDEDEMDQENYEDEFAHNQVEDPHLLVEVKTEPNDNEQITETNKEQLQPINFFQSGISKYHCQHCNKVFTYHYWYKKHLEQKHNETIESFPCPSCPETFTSRHLLANHEKCHVEDRNFQCSECPLKFLKKHHLDRHFASIHSSKGGFACHACGKEFSSYCSSRAHERNSTKCHQKISKMTPAASKLASRKKCRWFQ